MSERQGRRINGSEEGRKRPWGWILASIVALVLLLLIVPFACSALTGSNPGGSGDGQDNASGDSGNDSSDPATSSTGESTGTSASTTPEDTEAPEGTRQTPASENSGDGSGGEDSAGSVSAELAGFDGAEGDGTSVTVPAATVSGTDGWLVIRGSASEDAEVLGYAPLSEGSNSDVTVVMDEPVESGELYASIHADDPSGGEFDHPDGDPEIQSGGAAVSRSFEYATTGGGTDEPLPDTGGMSAATIKSVSGASLLLMGSVLIFIAKRRHPNASTDERE